MIGIGSGTLVKIYTALIRRIFEYALPCFATILTEEQSETLERFQRISLKTIYGLGKSYAECLEASGLERLDVRRDRLFLSFVQKSFESEKFGQRWYTEKQPSRYNLRREKRVVVNFAGRDRLLNAPLYRARKIINEIN